MTNLPDASHGIFNDIRKLAEFDRDFKKLVRKFKTLDEDLNTFIANQLKLTHKLNIDNKGVVRISDLGIEYPQIYKAKKFPCKALKGKGAASGIRVIYSHLKQGHIVKDKYLHVRETFHTIIITHLPNKDDLLTTAHI